MDKNIINSVIKFQKENNKIKIIEILSDFIDNNPNGNPLDIGWAYWLISDNYAMLRMAHEEFENHSKFVDLIENKLPDEMLHWFVSDGTQKLTLINGGYADFWYKLYVKACQSSPKTMENIPIRFESHRAAVSNPSIEIPNIEISQLALKNMIEVIKENPQHPNMPFYKITYYSIKLTIDYYLGKDINVTLEKAMEAFKRLISYLDQPVINEENTIVVSWEYLNSIRPLNEQAKVGINNFIIDLIDIFQIDLALECYKVFEDRNVHVNNYFKSKIEYAKSINK